MRPAIHGFVVMAALAAGSPARPASGQTPAKGGAARAAPVFEADILPILNHRCTECHGISKQSSGMRLDSFEGLQKGGKKGRVIIPGKSGESRLLELISPQGKPRMPPKGERATPEEIELIKLWIDGGARSAPPPASAVPEVVIGKLPAGFAPILAVVGSRDGALLAAGRGAAVVVTGLKDPQAAKIEAILDAGGDLVQCLAFSPDGKLLAAGGFREVLLWDTAGWTLKGRLGPHADRVLALDWSPDGDLLAAAGGPPTQSGEVKIWQARTGKLMRTFSDVHSDSVFAVDFSPDGTRLATGSADRMVHVLEVASGKRVARFEGHTHHVLAVAFSPDGKKLMSAGADSKIKQWDLEKGEAIRDWNGHGKAVSALAVSPDGKMAASVSGDRTLRFWNPENGGQVRSLGEAKDYLYALSIFGEGKLLAAAGRDRVVRIYSIADGKLVRSLDPPALP